RGQEEWGGGQRQTELLEEHRGQEHGVAVPQQEGELHAVHYPCFGRPSHEGEDGSPAVLRSLFGMKKTGAIVSAMIFLALPVAGGAPDREPTAAVANHLPLPSPGPAGSLRDRQDAGLQRDLEARVDAVDTLRALTRTRHMSVGLVDIRDPAAPRYAAINGDTMMYAASLPKIAILLAAFQAFEEGRLRE